MRVSAMQFTSAHAELHTARMQFTVGITAAAASQYVRESLLSFAPSQAYTHRQTHAYCFIVIDIVIKIAKYHFNNFIYGFLLIVVKIS